MRQRSGTRNTAEGIERRKSKRITAEDGGSPPSFLSFKKGDTEMKGYKHLTYTNRLQIEAWLKAKKPVAWMAEQIGCSRVTIYAELKRGRYIRKNSDWTYSEAYAPEIAEEKYQANLRAKGGDLKIGNDHELAEYLERKIAFERYSPEAALAQIKKDGLQFKTTISKATLYRYIDMGLFLHLSNKDLPYKGKRSSHYHRVRPRRAPFGKSIETRPKHIDTREEFGHWEMDCVVGRQGTKKALLVLTERKTRFERVFLLKEKTSDEVIKTVLRLRESFTEGFENIFKSITMDNGSEFSAPDKMKVSNLYYCHPYSSWERGSNENQNRMIRRFYPKGTDFTHVTDADIRKVEDWINKYPRPLFGYRSAEELYLEETLMLKPCQCC